MFKKIIISFVLSYIVINAQTVDQNIKLIENSGLSADQLKEIAKSRGFSKEQIDSEINLRNQNNVENKNNLLKDSNMEINDLNVNTNTDENEILSIENIEIQKTNTLEYYGYKIFEGDPTIFQTSTFGIVDPNYNIGSGDQIILMLWGESQFRQEFTVDREGYVFLPEVGQIFVNGLNLEALEKKFFQILSKVYSTLNPQSGKPTTFMDISLGNLRPLRIIVLGEVSQPGAYSVSPSTSLSSSLYYFNGPTISGSLRKISLIRKGKYYGDIDFYDYLLYGKVPNDIRLQMDDVIYISNRGKTISIKGQINRQGYYELNEDETMIDLIRIAGNLKVNAYTNRAQINRIVPNYDRKSTGMDRIVVDINLNKVLSNEQVVNLYDGDIVEIFPIEKISKNYVVLNSSSIARPGKYQLTDGMTLYDLIEKAGGLLNNAYKAKIHIKRINDDLTTKLITIDIEQNIDLEFLDEIFIYNNNEIDNLFSNISIIGPVKKPGTYEFRESNTIGDIIISTGGLKKNIENFKITLTRQDKDSFIPRIYYFPKSKLNYLSKIDLINNNSEINKFQILPNDIISIYADPKNNITQLVTISGAVYHPGSYPIINKDEKVSDIIKRAGGLLPSAYPKASNFIRNNTEVKLSFEKIINNPNSKDNFVIAPGDEIEILEYSNVVEIRGAVNQPGVYKYYKNYSIKDYIKISGGLTTQAEEREIWVTSPDGISMKHKKISFFSPKVHDGSIITVGLKADEEPFDITEYTKEMTTIFANIIQLFLLYNAVSAN